MSTLRTIRDDKRNHLPSTRLQPGSIRLLTPAEEYDLVHQLGAIRSKIWNLLKPLIATAPEDVRTDHFDQIMAYYNLHSGEVKKKDRTRVEKLMVEYSAIKHRLAVSNLPWVTKLARNQRQSTNIAEEDLFQEGVCGLLKAIDRFEPERGLRLMTYATWYIREAMQQIRARHSHLVAISSHDQTLLGQLEEKLSAFQHQNERLPFSKEVSELAKGNHRMLGQLQSATRPTVSLERGANDGAIPVPTEDPIPEFDREEELQFKVGKLLDALPERERQIVSLRFGLEGNQPTSLEELGESFHVSKERIRQLQRQAIRRMQEVAEQEDIEFELSL